MATVSKTFEDKHGLWRVVDWSKNGRNSCTVVVKKLLKLSKENMHTSIITWYVNLVSCLVLVASCVLGEDGSSLKPSHPTVEYKGVLLEQSGLSQ